MIAQAVSQAPAPLPPRPMDDPFAAYAAPAREMAAPQRLVADSAPNLFDPSPPSFGANLLRHKTKRPNTLYIAVGGAALAVIAVVVVIAATGGKKSASSAGSAAEIAPGSAAVAAPSVGQTDPTTGFDLYVNPPGVTTWRLDGEVRTDRLPSRIRGITPGVHQVAIDAPPGFVSQNQPVTVESGKAPKVEIVLSPLSITGEFESTPPSATVSLIVDGKKEPLGTAPAKSPLDPRKVYQVLFEKPGYVSVNRPILFTGQAEEKIVVTLEKAGAAMAPAPPQQPVTAPTPPPAVEKKAPPPVQVAKTEPKQEPKNPMGDVVEKKEPPKAAAGGNGTLLLGSKPPCEIYIDGSDTGNHTPQKDIKLPAGKHRITLVNNDFGIKETFTVDIKADQTEKAIKDYSDRLPK